MSADNRGWETERHIEDKEYYDDQDGGPNGHYSRIVIKIEETSTEKVIKFIEERIQQSPTIPDRTLATYRRPK